MAKALPWRDLVPDMKAGRPNDVAKRCFAGQGLVYCCWAVVPTLLGLTMENGFSEEELG